MTPASVILADLWFWFGADRDRAAGMTFRPRDFDSSRVLFRLAGVTGVPLDVRKSARAIRASVRTGCWVHIPDYRQTLRKLFDATSGSLRSRLCFDARLWLASWRTSRAAPDAPCQT